MNIQNSGHCSYCNKDFNIFSMLKLYYIELDDIAVNKMFNCPYCNSQFDFLNVSKTIKYPNIKKIIKIYKRLQEHLEFAKSKVENLEWVGIFLQGSQNYGLDYEGSDIDTKIITLPKFEDFVLNKKPLSTTLEMENKEHVDLKDIRLMFECFKKQNINFVEILFTDYCIINPKYVGLFQPMFDNREQIAHYNNYASVNCMFGMVLEKAKAMEHRYEGLAEKIDKYGYDSKQLHHALRCREFLIDYIDNKPYEKCLKVADAIAEMFIRIKTNNTWYKLETARIVMQSTVDCVKRVKEQYMNEHELVVDKSVEKLMNDILVDIIKHNFKTELEV